MIVAWPSDSLLEGAAKLVEAAGKGNLAFASFLVLVIAAIAWKFFGRDVQWVRIGAFLIIVGCIVFFIFVLAAPTGSKAIAKSPPTISESTPPADTKPEVPSKDTKRPPTAKQCSGQRDVIFTPDMPFVMQLRPDGSRVDLGDGGGGTRLEKWTYSWKAPATVHLSHAP